MDKKKYIMTHSGQLFMRNKIKLLKFISDLKIKIHTNQDGSRINLDICSKKEIDDIYNEVLNREQWEIENMVAGDHNLY